MNVGPSDIVQGIQALTWIWQNGFVRENSRDVRYENFRRDVQDFDSVLHDLSLALADAERRYRKRGASSALNPCDASFERERRRLIGAFNVTLGECMNVLERHKIAPQTNAQGVIQSLRWAAGTEDTVNRLRSRLQFHSQKMLLVINRLSLRLMTDSADRLDDILGLSEQSIVLHERTQAILQDTYALLAAHVQGRVSTSIALRPSELLPTPMKVAQRFQQRLSLNAPPQFAQLSYDPSKLPMEEAFNALMIHFASNADATAGSQTPEHYVQLLKMMWIVRQIQASQEYENARPGFYYRRAVNQIEQHLHARLKDPRRLSFDEEMLSALPDETYEIWPSPEPVALISQIDARPGEHEEVRLDLVLQGDFTQQQTVVFRRSEYHFRIVQENVRDVNGRIEQQISLSFDMNRDHFIPWYSLPSANPSSHEAAIWNQANEDLVLYRFRSSGDLYRFQEAFLGQRMVFENTNVKGTTSDLARAGSEEAFSECSRIGSTVTSIAPSTIFEHAEGVEGGSVPLPALVILTVLHGKVVYIYVKLEHYLRIFPEHCECRDGQAGYAKCKMLSLAREKLRKFPVYIEEAEVDEQGHPVFSSCDISVFRVPAHPRFRKIRPKLIDHLLMTFQTPTIKDAFNLELHQRFDLRNFMIKQHNDYDVVMLHNAERPERVKVPRAPLGHSLSRNASLAPSIGSLQLGDSFDTEMAMEMNSIPSVSRAMPNDEVMSSAPNTRSYTDVTTRAPLQQRQRTLSSEIAPTRPVRASRGSRQPSTSSGIGGLLRSWRS